MTAALNSITGLISLLAVYVHCCFPPLTALKILPKMSGDTD